MNFIGSHCDLSDFTWPSILHCALDNGFLVEDAYIYRGANHQLASYTE